VQLDGQPARVIDDLRGRSWEVEAPSPMCTAIGVAAANVLWSCPGVDPQLQQARTGALRPVPGWNAYDEWFAAIAFGWVGSPPFPSTTPPGCCRTPSRLRRPCACTGAGSGTRCSPGAAGGRARRSSAAEASQPAG
jgi:hypothetical protein